jgi:hypothetical protein
MIWGRGAPERPGLGEDEKPGYMYRIYGLHPREKGERRVRDAQVVSCNPESIISGGNDDEPVTNAVL